MMAGVGSCCQQQRLQGLAEARLEINHYIAYYNAERRPSSKAKLDHCATGTRCFSSKRSIPC